MVGYSFRALRMYMIQAGHNQGTLAKAAGMCETTLSTRMTRKQPWTADEMISIAKVLEIPPEKFGEVFCELHAEEPKGKQVRFG